MRVTRVSIGQHKPRWLFNLSELVMVPRMCCNQIKNVDVPSRVCKDPMKLLLAELAKVVLRCLVLVHDTNATSMLPHTTFVALYEQSSSIFRIGIQTRLVVF